MAYILNEDNEQVWQDEPATRHLIRKGDGSTELRENCDNLAEGEVCEREFQATKKEHCVVLHDGNCEYTVEVDATWDTENRPEPSDEIKMAAIRQERNRLLAECDFIISRHIEQLKLVGLDIMVNTVLTEQQYQVWLEYRQNLRDFPDSVNVSNPIYPTEPST